MSAPLRVSFLMTNRCNARCNFCMVAPYFLDPPNQMTLRKFNAIATNMHMEKTCNSICLSGAGDPLVNTDTLPIIQLINNKYPGMPITLISNGIALSKETSDALIKLSITEFFISVNAATPETYRRTMQVDCFDKVIENIRYYRSLEKTPPMALSFVAHRGNIEDLPAFVTLTADLGIKRLNARYAKFYSTGHRACQADNADTFLNQNQSLFYYQDLSDRYFQQAIDMSRQLGIQFTNVDDPLFCASFKKQTCCFPFNSILVGLDGEVLPCCGGESIFKAKVAGGEYDFGNLLTHRLEDFYDNKLWKAIRYSAAHPGMATVPECKVCSIGVSWDGHIKKRHIMEWDTVTGVKGHISRRPVRAILGDFSHSALTCLFPSLRWLKREVWHRAWQLEGVLYRIKGVKTIEI